MAVGHIVGSDVTVPELHVYDEGLHRIRMTGAMRLQVEGPITCIGRPGPDGWQACPDQVEGVQQCRACFGPDRPECVFEPLCATGGCACTFGPVPHVVYLAFYGILPKVGMTQQRRLHARLSEQGADAYLVLEEHESRAQARAAERRIALRHQIPEWRTHRESLPQLHRPVPWDELTRRADDWRGRLGAGPLHRVAHALEQPLPAPVHRVDPLGVHDGVFLGGKGAHFVYEAPSPLAIGAAPLYALPRHALAGRHAQIDKKDE